MGSKLVSQADNLYHGPHYVSMIHGVNGEQTRESDTSPPSKY